MDFSIFYKDSFLCGDITTLESYDLFLSAYDNCKRTKEIYQNVKALKKTWFIFPHYKLKEEELPSENIYLTLIIKKMITF